MSARKVLHPLTLASIEAQRRGGATPEPWCGCEQRGGKWWLCGYHEGFEDALDDLDEHITRLIEAGDALYDRIAPATNTTDATQLEAWLAAASGIDERSG